MNDLKIERVYSNPITIFGADYSELQSFYQYFFPPQKDSLQAWGLQENMTDSQKNELLGKMMASIRIVGTDLLFSSTYTLKNNPDMRMIQLLGLSDSTFFCDRRKGFSRITNKTNNRESEHKLTSISRHLRNAFAHGRIGAFNDYVLFEDVSSRIKGGQIEKSITARFVLIKDDLMTWKDVIEHYIAEKSITVEKRP